MQILQIILFTLVAVVLYFAADWIVNKIEHGLGKRLKYRSIVFFALLLGMALLSFRLLQTLLAGQGAGGAPG